MALMMPQFSSHLTNLFNLEQLLFTMLHKVVPGNPLFWVVHVMWENLSDTHTHKHIYIYIYATNTAKAKANNTTIIITTTMKC